VTKKEVPGVEGVIRIHPDEIKLKGQNKTDFFLFYDFEKKVLFVSSTKEIYEKITNHLPETTIPGNRVDLIGTLINPLTIFSKEDLQQESKRMGVDLNKYKVVKITNWALGTETITQKPKQQRQAAQQQSIEPLVQPAVKNVQPAADTTKKRTYSWGTAGG
jgi:hypothetical protein